MGLILIGDFLSFIGNHSAEESLLSKVAAVLVIPLKTESNEIPLTSLVMMLNITKLIDFEKC